MQDVYDKPIAVLGGGAGGQTMAADISLAGNRVRLYELPEFEGRIKEVMKSQKIEIVGDEANAKNFRRNGVAEVDLITSDMSEALENVGLINVVVPALGHEKFFDKMIPYLEDGQFINIFPDNYGSLLLKHKLVEDDIDVDVIIGGWSSLPYATRSRGMEPGRVNLANRTVELRGDTLPSEDWGKFLKIMKNFPPLDPTKIKKGDTVLDIGFSNPNPAVHVPGSVLNVGHMENYGKPEKIYGDEESDYSLYIQGTSPSVSKLMWEFYREERKIAEAIGIEIEEWREEDFMSKSNIMLKHYMGREFEIPFEDRDWSWVVGPQTVEDRYFMEDIAVGTNIYYELAENFGVSAPLIESFIRIGSAICGHDFMEEGRSLSDLGISSMSREQLLKYLREGI